VTFLRILKLLLASNANIGNFLTCFEYKLGDSLTPKKFKNEASLFPYFVTVMPFEQNDIACLLTYNNNCIIFYKYLMLNITCRH
jgi:hypothetical protein